LSERYELMHALATKVPPDVKLITQTTIRTADDPPFLKAMSRAHICGALVGIEAVEPEGLAVINKRFNKCGEALIRAIQTMQEHGVYVLGSHIVGLSPDTPETYEKMLAIARQSGMALAQFALYVCFPGTVDYELMRRHKH